MSELARLAGVPTPTMDALISLASTARCVDFRSAGLTLARMGLAGVSTSDLSRRVRD
jgi:opine dehydrogenase